MNKKLFLLTMSLVVLAFSACTSIQEQSDVVNSTSEIVSKDDIESFVSEYLNLIIEEKYEDSLNYFAPDYVSEQLEVNLNGNIEQFLCEFLSGESPSGYITPSISEIAEAKIDNIIIIDSYTAIAEVMILLNDGNTIGTVINVLIDSDGMLYLIGAMG